MKSLTYEAGAGQHIESACREASTMARQNKTFVRFLFNGIRLFATPKKSPATIEWEFDEWISKEMSGYRASSEGKAAAQKRSDDINLRQAHVDALTAALPEYLKVGLDGAVNWLANFHESANDIAVKCDFPAIIAALEATGYRENAHVGRPKEEFQNRQVCGEYIVGQAINYMRNGMPPHPITEKFCKQYFAL